MGKKGQILLEGLLSICVVFFIGISNLLMGLKMQKSFLCEQSFFVEAYQVLYFPQKMFPLMMEVQYTDSLIIIQTKEGLCQKKVCFETLETAIW